MIKISNAVMLAGALGLATPHFVTAQTAPTSTGVGTTSPVMPPSMPTVAPASQLTGSAQLVEETPLEIEINEPLSSGTSNDGDRFSIVLAEAVKLPNGVVLPAGYRGRGTVMHAQKRGFIGKAGELNVSFDYIRIGETRVRLRATKGGTGKGSLGSAVALTVLFGPLGLLARGANIVIPKGQVVTAYVDTTATVPMPLAPPPTSDEL